MTVAIPTGIEGLDSMLGGFHVGDNIILEVSVATPAHQFLETVIDAALTRGDVVRYVSFDASLATMRDRLKRFGDRVTLVDCFAHGKNATGNEGREEAVPRGSLVVDTPQYPEEFRLVLQRLADASRRNLFVIDSLSGMATLWADEDRVARFYGQVCPRLFDEGDIAIWVLHRGVHQAPFHAKIAHIAQVVLSLDLHDGIPSLMVERAVGRTDQRLRHPVSYREGPNGFALGDA